MRSIFIGSTGGEPGQTLAAWALAIRVRGMGLRTGFFKPFGRPAGSGASFPEGMRDPDVVLFQRVLGLTEPEEILCPVRDTLSAAGGGETGEALMERIGHAFQIVSRDKDVVLIMGGREIFFGEGSGFSDSVLVKGFDCSVLLVDRYQRDNLTFYSLLSLNSFLDGRVKAAILNHVSPDRLEHVKTRVVPFLREKGLKSVQAVPEDDLLAGFTVSSIAEWIGGEVMSGREKATHLVRASTIGSRSLEGPLSILRQVYNKVLLIGVDPDGSGKQPIVGVILTGGKKPSEMVVKITRERSLPLIVTPADTFQVMERLETPKIALKAEDEFKVSRFLQFIDPAGSGSWMESLLSEGP